eukprot:3741552-Amphidinium_carterae.2
MAAGFDAPLVERIPSVHSFWGCSQAVAAWGWKPHACGFVLQTLHGSSHTPQMLTTKSVVCQQLSFSIVEDTKDYQTSDIKDSDGNSCPNQHHYVSTRNVLSGICHLVVLAFSSPTNGFHLAFSSPTNGFHRPLALCVSFL